MRGEAKIWGTPTTCTIVYRSGRYQKAACQRQNWIHHASTQIISGNSLVATEKLEVKNLTHKANKGSKRKRQKAGLNRSILDVGWGKLTQAIRYKLAEGEGIFIEVPTT